MKTMKDAAEMALFAQDACNLSGLVHSFKQMMDIINEEAYKNGHGTEWRNTHPICTIMLNKMSQLARADENFSRAYKTVQKMAAEESAVEGG